METLLQSLLKNITCIKILTKGFPEEVKGNF